MTSVGGMALCPEIVSDLDVQEWVQKHYAFVPHPFWIRDCKERYLHGRAVSLEAQLPWHVCPEDKLVPIKAAFRHFGLMR